MLSHNAIAKQVRIAREANPDAYCPKCMWLVQSRTGRTPCPRHMNLTTEQVAEAAIETAKQMTETEKAELRKKIAGLERQ